MRQIEASSSDEPYLTFELFTRTPLPPELAKTTRFPRDPDTTKFVRQPIDDTVPFAPFEGAELAIMAPTRVAERRIEDDSIEIEIVESGEIARVEALPESSSVEISASALEPLDLPEQVDQDRWAATVQLPASAFLQLEPLQVPIESAFLPAFAEPLEAAESFAHPKRASWQLPVAIVLFLAGAFAVGLGVAFALS